MGFPSYFVDIFKQFHRFLQQLSAICLDPLGQCCCTGMWSLIENLPLKIKEISLLHYCQQRNISLELFTPNSLTVR